MVRAVRRADRIGRSRTHVLLIALCAVPLLVTGCGDPGGAPCSVSGTVTFDGKPIESGAVRFSTEDGTAGPGGLGPIVDGRYEVTLEKGLRAGRYHIAVLGFRKTGRKIKVDENSDAIDEEIQYIPAKFNNASELRIELKGGENHENFDLKK